MTEYDILLNIINGVSNIYGRPMTNEFERLVNYIFKNTDKRIVVLCGNMKKLREYRNLYDKAVMDTNGLFEKYIIGNNNRLMKLQYSETNNTVIFALKCSDVKGMGINYIIIGDDANMDEYKKDLYPVIKSYNRSIEIKL